MGVDTKVWLRPGTQSSDVADVCSILLGHEPRLGDFKNEGRTVHFVRTDAEVEPGSTVPGMLTIKVKGTRDDGEDALWATYHIDGGDSEWHHSTGTMDRIGWPMLFLRSRPDRIALAVRLADLFGGVVDFNDCDDEYSDYYAPGSPFRLPGGGEWEKWQAEMFMVGALTDEFIDSFTEHAAYNRPSKGGGWR